MPGHFKVRKSLSQITACAFSQKSRQLFLSLVVTLKTQAANVAEFRCQNNTNKALPKQSNRQGGARAVDLPARSFDLVHHGVAPPLAKAYS